MRKFPKLSTGGGIALLVVLGGLFLIGKTGDAPAPSPTLSAPLRTKTTDSAERAADALAIAFEPGATEPRTTVQGQENLSEKVLQELLGGQLDIQKLLGDGTTLDPEAASEELTSQILSAAAEHFKPEELRPTVKLQELIISKSETTGDRLRYFEKLREVVQKNIGGSLRSGIPTLNDVVVLRDNLEQVIKDLYALPAPPSLADWHRREVELIKAQYNVVSAVADARHDPLRALVALQFWQALNDEFASFNRDLAAAVTSGTN